VVQAPLRASVDDDWKRRGNGHDTFRDRTAAPGYGAGNTGFASH
jgi:hypothetical protein